MRRFGKPKKKSSIRDVPSSFVRELREHKIFEVFAPYIAGSWLTYEVVHWVLVEHLRFPDELLDIALVTLSGAFAGLFVRQWFKAGREKPRGIKVEVLVIPVIVLLALALDIKFILAIFGIHRPGIFFILTALSLGVVWILIKSLQWAARSPDAWTEEAKDLIDSNQQVEKSIVVLPFKNISPEGGQEYLSDGITEEIICDLSRVRALRVISRSSAMTFKNSPKTVPEIGRELNVQYALEGTVRKAGDDLRITAQLIEVALDTHLWTQKYVGTLADIFNIQEKVALAIVAALKQKLAPDEEKTLTEQPTLNLRAYESYLIARRDMYQCSEESLKRALHSLSQAVENYGENALLDAAMGLVYLQLYNQGFKKDEETIKKAERLLDRITILEPESPARYHLLGTIERSRGQVNEAVNSLKRAAELDPNDPDTLGWLGILLCLNMGKPDIGKPYVKRLLEIDPLTPWNYYVASAYYLAKGKKDRALSMIRRSVEMDPAARNLRFWEAWHLAWNDQPKGAIDLINNMGAERGDDLASYLGLLLKYALQREKEKALKTLNKKNRDLLWNDTEGPWLMADIFALLDEKDEALSWLERATARGWANYPLFSSLDPFLAGIKGEGRFQKLIEHVKHVWERFEEPEGIRLP